MSKGFTLIELLVSISIMAILASVLFMQRGPQEKQLELQIAAFELANNVRRAQEMAMGANKSVCNPPITPFVFGVYFGSALPLASYITFTDCNGNRVWQQADTDVVENSLSFNKDVEIYAISQSPLSVVFEPPDPIVYQNGSIAFGEIIIGLRLKADHSKTKQVKINPAGRIEIE